MKRSTKGNNHFRKLPEDARQYVFAPNSPWSFPGEVSIKDMGRQERLISVIKSLKAHQR